MAVKKHSEETKQKIREMGAATRKRHRAGVTKVFELKLNSKKMSGAQREMLRRAFLEAKWLYNE